MEDSSNYKPGDAVLTAYGAGVIVHREDDNFYVVRLWRIPGFSLAQSTKATLHKNTIKRKLPGAPGMHTLLEGRKCMILAYYEDQDAFLVDEEQQQTIITSKDMLPAPAAKFYPVLENLIVRANEAAVVASNVLNSEQTKEAIPKMEEKVKNAFSQATEAASKALDKEPNVEAPKVNESVNEVLKLIKDEELTTLFTKCKSRLEEIVQTDIPRTTKDALNKVGIQIEEQKSEDDESPFSQLVQSREKALSSLKDMLKTIKAGDVDLNEAREKVAKKFQETFDSLASAAKSDRSLNNFFTEMTEKTTEWQKAAGRLMNTKSASLFAEGAGRLQSRAATILAKHNFDWAGELGSKLTKSLTEGDAAVARVKSLEIGETVKTRLVEAIQARSEAKGGLDGIIAGALSSLRNRHERHAGRINSMLTDLQQKASSKKMDTHETLISLLSQRSAYQNVALLRVETVLCDIESRFGDEMNPEEIAALARGEGGTASIFQPIAKKAGSQIDKLLSDAETQVQDPNTINLVKKIRQILSGTLSVSTLTDDLVKFLDDEQILSAGQSIVQHGEHVLDAIEGATDDRAFDEALKVAEKAGISKDSVLREVGKLDVNKLLDDAGNAISDEQARRRFVSNATDVALDFVLRVLPSMPVPPFEGVKDGLVYHISNLSMQGFRVKKENIHLQLAGIRATKKSKVDATIESLEKMDSLEMTQVQSEVKASELLIIEVDRISAILNDAEWSFEQTYLPYLKGDGKSDVSMSDGRIRLQFELKRQKNETGNWEPVLCLHDRSCSIDSVELTIQGEGKLAWIVNKLASIFKGPLRDYVVKTILNIISSKSGMILERLNAILSPYWDLIMKTAKLDLLSLSEVREEDIVRSTSVEEMRTLELVWRDRLPLGMNLLMNDSSGLLKVVDFPRGSQARLVCERRRLDPDLFKGSTIISVNGKEFDSQEDLFEALRDPGRPKTVGFQIAESTDAERVRKFVEGPESNEPKEEIVRCFATRTVVIDDASDIGLQLRPTMDGFGWTVSGFIEGDGGIVLAAERTGQIEIGDLLTHVNGKVVIGTQGKSEHNAAKLLEEEGLKRPLSLTFSEPYQTRIIYTEKDLLGGPNNTHGPNELKLSTKVEKSGRRRIVVESFVDVSATVENSGVLIGDHLVFVNGIPVGAGVRWLGEGSQPSLSEVMNMITNDSMYPIGLTFARPRQKGSRWENSFEKFDDSEAETFCVTLESKEMLGCALYENEFHDIVVRDFDAIEGSLQRAIKKGLPDASLSKPTIEWINGDFVPSYASPLMVKNALKRVWKHSKRIDIWLSDDDRKEWLTALLSENGN